MTLKSIIAPLALAVTLALGSALPASAAFFDGDFVIQFKQRPPIDQSSLTPAQRTQLEDQCRAMQAEDSQGTSHSQFDNDTDNTAAHIKANRQYCIDIGIV
jgi:Spy/CpxP family protein refolding chaperone